MSKIILRWLRWRYGGDVGGVVNALRPPLGYHRTYSPRPWGYIALYWVKRFLWKIEKAAFSAIQNEAAQ